MRIELAPYPTSGLQTPLAQLQQQTEMWHNFHGDMRPRLSGNPYMVQEIPPPYQHQPSPPLSIPSPMMMDTHRQTPHVFHPVNCASMPITPPLSNISMTPPHSNENVPPDDGLHQNQMAKSTQEESYDSKQMMESVQPLMENRNLQQNDSFVPIYGGQIAPQQFEKMEEVKMKKVRLCVPAVPPQIRASTKKPSPKPLPDFNEAFGSTERGRFQSPPDPRLAPNKGYLDFFYEDSSQIKFEDFQI
ncbi:hypothetical protein NQ317_002906 [Molorchus minor]|uniref:Uncharacterized protein n=1 Tax=Molorchus minor TaxID=1323400 RepID=A0ABQ9JKK6_9CUCU|nr:hypothetical protein NQ317_002906 [Molorchus minor]